MKYETKPLISVIIPAANSEETIMRAINSTRTHVTRLDKLVEVIVVVNNSTDHTYELVKHNISANQIDCRLMRSDPGRSCARNTGLVSASGKIGILLDSDDELVPKFIKAVVDCADLILNNHTPVYCRAVHVKDLLDEKESLIDLPDPTHITEINPFVIETVAFAIQDIRYFFDESLSLCEDWKFWAMNFKNSDFHKLDLIGARVHITGNNSMSSVKELLKADTLVRLGLYRFDNHFNFFLDSKRIIYFSELNPTEDEMNCLRSTFGIYAKVILSIQHLLMFRLISHKLFERKIHRTVY